MGKTVKTKPPPGVYRDDPDRDDAASTSSAVPLDSVAYPDEAELPPYEDVPSISAPASNNEWTSRNPPSSYLTHPEIPSSHLSRDRSTTTTHMPLYSQDATFLSKMLRLQSHYPPEFAVRLHGTHTETVRKSDGKTEKNQVTDFDISLSMTHLLIPTPTTPPSLAQRSLKTLSPNTKTYRGTRTKTICPSPESAPDVESYIQDYITSPHPIRAFTFRREIQNYDHNLLTTLLTSLVNGTNYRGHTSITSLSARDKITIYSPCWQNTYREKTWLRWLFYLTFLWIFAWPYLWFATRRWEVAVAAFPYADKAPREGGRDEGRTFVVKSESAFFEEWRKALRRAVLGRMQGWVDEEYLRASEEEGERGVVDADGFGAGLERFGGMMAGVGGVAGGEGCGEEWGVGVFKGGCGWGRGKCGGRVGC